MGRGTPCTLFGSQPDNYNNAKPLTTLQEASIKHRTLAGFRETKRMELPVPTTDIHRAVKLAARRFTFASGVTTGFGGNCTSVAFRIVFSCRISCCDWL